MDHFEKHRLLDDIAKLGIRVSDIDLALVSITQVRKLEHRLKALRQSGLSAELAKEELLLHGTPSLRP